MNDLNMLVLLMRNKSEPAGVTYALPMPGSHNNYIKSNSLPEYSCVVERRCFIFMPGFIVKRIPQIHKVIK